MLCPKCGIDVGDIARLCDRCESVQRAAVQQQQTSSDAQVDHQHLNVQFDPAGFWLRFFAMLIDVTIVGVLNWLLFDLLLAGLFEWSLKGQVENLSQQLSGGTQDPSTLIQTMLMGLLIQLAGFLLLTFVAQLLIGLIYYPAFESSKLQGTPGKLAFGLLVTDGRSQPVSFQRAMVRHASRILCIITLGAGYLMVGFTARKQGLHDLLADCLVLKNLQISTGQRVFAAIGAVIVAILWVGIFPNLVGKNKPSANRVSRVSSSSFLGAKSLTTASSSMLVEG